MTTKADAVNRVLNLVGKMDQAAPGSSPDDKTDTAEGASSSSTASYVERFLDRNEREVQENDWYWNTEYDIEIALIDGKANLPTPVGGTGEILQIDTVEQSRYQPVVMKDDSGTTRLFNLTTNTFLFTSTLRVKYQYRVRFDQIPSSAMDFIISKTAYDVNMAYQFNPAMQAQLGMLVARQEMLMRKDDINQDDINILATSEAAAIRGRFSHTSRRR